MKKKHKVSTQFFSVSRLAEIITSLIRMIRENFNRSRLPINEFGTKTCK